MYNQRLLSQTAGRVIACCPANLLKDVKKCNQINCNSILNAQCLSHINFKMFHSQFKKSHHRLMVMSSPRKLDITTVYSIRKCSSNLDESAHNLLCSLPEYSSTIAKFSNSPQIINSENENQSMTADNQDISMDNLIQQFKIYSYMLNNPSTDEESVRCLLMSLSEKGNNLSYSQMLDILSSAKLWQTTMSNNEYFVDFLKSIEMDCCKNVEKLSLSQSLLLTDYWYQLSGFKSSAYLKCMLHTHVNYFKNFSKSQFVQYMFYANMSGDTTLIKRSVLLMKLKKIIPFLSINEIGIIAMVLRKISSYKMPGIDQLIAKKLIAEKSAASEEMLDKILKYFRKVNISDKICFSILDAFHQEIDKYDYFVQMQFCNFASYNGIYHKEFMNKLINFFAKNLHSLRIREIERLLYAAVLFNTEKADHQYIFPLVIEELRKTERTIECNAYPHIFASCVSYFTAAGLYPVHFISTLFQPSMLQHMKGLEGSLSYKNMCQLMVEINSSLCIGGPSDYTGYKLESSCRDKLTKECITSLADRSAKSCSKEKIYMSINGALSALLQPASSSVVNILPQFKSSELVFCTNSEGKAVEIPESYFQQSEVHARLPVCIEDGIKWNAVILVSSMLKPNNNLNGIYMHKIRLLKELGYVVSMVPLADEGLVRKGNLYFKKALCESTLNMENITFQYKEQFKPSKEHEKIEQRLTINNEHENIKQKLKPNVTVKREQKCKSSNEHRKMEQKLKPSNEHEQIFKPIDETVEKEEHKPINEYFAIEDGVKRVNKYVRIKQKSVGIEQESVRTKEAEFQPDFARYKSEPTFDFNFGRRQGSQPTREKKKVHFRRK